MYTGESTHKRTPPLPVVVVALTTLGVPVGRSPRDHMYTLTYISLCYVRIHHVAQYVFDDPIITGVVHLMALG
jgi:hypothetical protein